MFRNFILQVKEASFIKKLFSRCYRCEDVKVAMDDHLKDVEKIVSEYKAEAVLYKDKIKTLEGYKVKSTSLIAEAKGKVEEIRKSKIILVNDLEYFKKQATENKKKNLNCDGSFILSMDKKISKLNTENEKLKKENLELRKKICKCSK